MRLLLCLLCFSVSVPLCLSAQEKAPSLDQPLGFTLPEMPLPDALRRIEQATEWRFSYSPQDLPATRRVALRDANQSLRTTMNTWLRSTGLSYRVIGGQVVMFRERERGQNRRIAKRMPQPQLSGYVVDAESGERLPYAKVWDARSGRGTVANAYGFFSLTLPRDSVTLLASFPDYVGRSRTFYLSQSQRIEIPLQPYLNLAAVSIETDRSSTGPDEADMSTISLPVTELNYMPTLLGEVDALRAVQLLPGVQSGSEGQVGLYVRGGSPDQNLVLLDGVPLYYVSHWGGFASVFNADALSDVRLIKGGFPARYGGRLSSVLEVTMKEGNRRETQFAGSIGLLSAKASVQGPIGKKPGQEEAHTSYILSARRNYFDLIMRGISLASGNPDEDAGPLSYGFYDLNAKVNHILSDKDRLYLSGYWGQDRSRIRSESNRWIREDGSTWIGEEAPPDWVLRQKEQNTSRIQWGNALAALRWNHVWSHRAFSNLSLSYSQYRYDNDQRFDETRSYPQDSAQQSSNRLRFASAISDAILRWEMDFYLNHQHQLKWGAQATLHRYQPGVLQERLLLEQDTLRDTLQGDFGAQGYEGFVFVEHDWRIGARLRVHSGLHAAVYRFGQRNYFSLQPRLSARLLLSDRLAFKASYARMTQFLHLLVNQSVGIPVDLWVPATDQVPPQQSDQFAAGLSWQSPNGQWEASLEGYYKQMSDLIDYREGYSLFEGTRNGWENAIEDQGRGQAYGGELLVRKRKGRLRGWLGYTLAWNWRQFDEINDGARYPFRYDRRHDLSLVGIYSLKPHIELSATWVFSTGQAITLPTGRHESFFEDRNAFPEPGDRGRDVEGDIYLYEGGRNNFRMRAYHRLDLGISFHKEKKWGTRTWRLGLYNAYNRRNPFYYDLNRRSDPDQGQQGDLVLTQLSLFPIMPSVSYGVEF